MWLRSALAAHKRRWDVKRRRVLVGHLSDRLERSYLVVGFHRGRAPDTPELRSTAEPFTARRCAVVKGSGGDDATLNRGVSGGSYPPDGSRGSQVVATAQRRAGPKVEAKGNRRRPLLKAS